MSNNDVVDYLFDSIYKYQKDFGIKYIKWDMNRSLTEVSSEFLDFDRQGEVSRRYMLGVYRIHKLMADAFPDVLFEGCCGGGGRFDAGMLFYVSQMGIR